jgi:hypothetical protein
MTVRSPREQTWRQTGLGAPDDIDALKQRTVNLEQQVVNLRLHLEERDDELAAARAANRELMTPPEHHRLSIGQPPAPVSGHTGRHGPHRYCA